MGFGFSLILLDKYAKDFKKTDFYAEKYLKTFGLGKNEKRPEHVYTLRTFNRFLDYFGHIVPTDYGFLNVKDVKRTQLSNDLIKILTHKNNLLLNKH